jgi:transposase
VSKISVIGLDLAKNVFQVHGVDEGGFPIVKKKLRRKDLLRFFAKAEPCLVGMEACGGAHYWAREISKFGHDVKMMAPAFVKPYLKANKNDANDAEAICEAVQRPNMRFVTPKSPEQQSVLHLHHARRLLVRQRVALGNHIHGVLLEFGICLPTGNSAAIRQLPYLLEDAENGLPMITRHMLAELSALSQRLETIPGVGLLTATVLSAAVGDGRDFSNGRQLAAYLGLVPRQASSGGKDRLLGISKRGG